MWSSFYRRCLTDCFSVCQSEAILLSRAASKFETASRRREIISSRLAVELPDARSAASQAASASSIPAGRFSAQLYLFASFRVIVRHFNLLGLINPIEISAGALC